MKAAFDAGRTIVYLPRTLNLESSDPWKDAINALVEAGFKDIVCDFSENTFIDSAGLGEIVRSYTICRRSGGSLTLNRIGTRVRDLLEITRLLTVFEVSNVALSHLHHFELSAQDLAALEAAATVGGLPTISVVANITPEVLRSLKEEPTRLRQLTAEQFELFTCERLDRMGFSVTRTGATNRKDGGLDIIGAKHDPAFGDYVIAAQVKHHHSDIKTGSPAVRDLLSFNNSIFKFGLLVTNTAFTDDAVWRAAQSDARWFARLRDFEDMRRWLEENFVRDRELTDLPEEIELAPGVKIKIPRPKVRRSRSGTSN